MKIKKINYKIVPNGRWKSDRIAKIHGRYTYPILVTIIEDINGEKIEVPLSYNQCAEILRKQIFLERYIDHKYPRISYASKVIDGINMILNLAKKEPMEKVNQEMEEMIKNGI